jgi:hypothetical protein
MIEALIAGERDPAKLASFADRRLKASQQTLRQVLRGRVTAQHRFLLRLHLDQIDALDAAIARIDREVEASIAPFRTAVEQVRTVPGIKSLAAQTILSEIGIDMSRFSSSGHLISWACICPRSDESAGKRRSTRIRKGSPWLKTTLVQCAWAATRKKGSYLQAQYYRIRARRGPKKAIVAVAASILTAIFTCSRTERCIKTSVPTTSMPTPRNGRRTVSSNALLTSGTLWSSHPFPTSAAPAEGLFLFSSPPATPPALADLHPMKLDSHRVVGTEVGLSLVPSSPFFSWTRGPRSTSPCRHGPSSAPEHVS